LPVVGNEERLTSSSRFVPVVVDSNDCLIINKPLTVEEVFSPSPPLIDEYEFVASDQGTQAVVPYLLLINFTQSVLFQSWTHSQQAWCLTCLPKQGVVCRLPRPTKGSWTTPKTSVILGLRGWQWLKNGLLRLILRYVPSN